MTMKREKNNSKGGKEVKIMFFEVLYGIHLIFCKVLYELTIVIYRYIQYTMNSIIFSELL